MRIKGETIVRTLDRQAKIGAVLADVAKKHDVSIKLIRSTTREAYVVKARREALYLIRILYGWSLPTIARQFRMHHTSVMHHIRRHCIASNLPMPIGLRAKHVGR